MSEQTNTEFEAKFFRAIKNGDTESVRRMASEAPSLLEANDYESFGGTPLNVVVFQKDQSMIDCLLDIGADPNRASDWWAGPWNAVQSALNSGHDELAEHFVRQGAKVGAHEAAGLGRIGELAALLESDPALVYSPGGDGCTPLHFACSPEVVDLLVANGADLNARDVDHYSTAAQYLAKNRPAVTRYLFEIGAEADIFSAVLAKDQELVQRLVSDDPAVLQKRINQETFPPGPHPDVHNILTFLVGHQATVLHAAASAGHLAMVEWLVKNGLSVNICGGYDESTALHAAAWNNDLPVARKLVELQAEVDKPSGEIHNNTPAGWAIVAGSADVFSYLMDCGATEQEYFLDDAKAGVDGKFRQYKIVNQEHRDRILARLISSPGNNEI